MGGAIREDSPFPVSSLSRRPPCSCYRACHRPCFAPVWLGIVDLCAIAVGQLVSGVTPIVQAPTDAGDAAAVAVRFAM